jgi:HAD superfamily hydrolase (TIGR01509 family)
MSPRFEALIFDFDGTLCNSEDLHKSCFIESLKLHGYSWCSKKELIYQLSKNKKTFNKLMLLSEQGLLDKKDIININSLKQELTIDRIKTSKMDEEVFNFLLSLKNVTLAIASDANRNTILSFLQHNQAFDLFKLVATSEDVGLKTKPSSKVYEFALNKLSVSSDKVAVFEDTNEGIEAATNAGIQFVYNCTYKTLHNTLQKIKGSL